MRPFNHRVVVSRSNKQEASTVEKLPQGTIFKYYADEAAWYIRTDKGITSLNSGVTFEANVVSSPPEIILSEGESITLVITKYT